MSYPCFYSDLNISHVSVVAVGDDSPEMWGMRGGSAVSEVSVVGSSEYSAGKQESFSFRDHC